MKQKSHSKLCAAILAAALFAGMSVSAGAIYDPMRVMEENSRRVVAAAISQGLVPPDATIFDCAYGEGSDGSAVVVHYRNKDGVWIDIAMRQPIPNQNLENVSTAPLPTEQELAEYAAEVFRLANQERLKVGLDEVVWDEDFAYCAEIRAEELWHRYSHYRPQEPTAGRDDWPVLTNGKIGTYNAPSVADEQGVDYSWVMENIGVQYKSPEAAIESWMNSPGHRANILKESHTRCGVGVLFTEERSPAGHNKFWVIWFDE